MAKGNNKFRQGQIEFTQYINGLRRQADAVEEIMPLLASALRHSVEIARMYEKAFKETQK